MTDRCENNHMQTHWNGCDCARRADRHEARLAALRAAREVVSAAIGFEHGVEALDAMIGAEEPPQPRKEND